MTNTLQGLLNHVRVIVGAWRDDPRDDTQLLARFVESRDERAFTTLLGRHGPMVWRTCTRVLRDGPDAEDAFQTTFLALARKAGQLRGDTLAGWLHRVARQAALDTEIKSRKRRSLEYHLQAVMQSEATEIDRTELYAALDEELAGLPERLRVPLLLHYLEGRSQVEVAHILGCARRALQKRLARGEAILRHRLERRGLTMGAGSMAALLGSSTAASGVPVRLISSTVRAALRSLSFPLESSASSALVEGVMKTVLVTKMKIVTVLLGMTLCLAGGGLLAYQTLAGNEVELPQSVSESRREVERPSQPGAVARVDCYGDPLPPHALARMGTTRLWYGTNSHAVPPLAFSPDGKTLATHIDGMMICLWDASAGKEIRRLTTKTVKGHIASLGFSRDGKKLIAVNGEQTVCSWDVVTGKFLRKQEYQGPKKDNGQSLTVAFLPDGQILGFADFLKSVKEWVRGAYIWDVATGKEICQLSELWKREDDPFIIRTFSADGKLLATVINKEEKARISLWDVATGKEIRHLIHQDGGVNAVAFSPDNKTLTSGCIEKICVWEVATGKKIHRFQSKGWVNFGGPLVYSPDGKTLLVGTEGHLWDVGTGKEIRSFGCKGGRTALFSSDGKVLAMGDQAGAIHLWEVGTGKEIGPRKGYRGPVWSVAYSPDGKTLASIGQEGETTVRLWEVATGKEMRSLAKHAGSGTGSIAYSPDGKMLVSMEHSMNVLHLWDTATGKEIRKLEREGRGDGLSWWATFSPDSKKLAASWGNKVCVLDVASGKQIYTLETQQERRGWRQVSIAFSPDGRLLATHGKENTVCLWEVAAGKLIGQLGRPKKRSPEGRSLFVFSLAFSSDSRLLVTSSSGELEGKVRVWEVASGKEITQLAALKPRFNHGCVLAFSPDGGTLATAAQGHDDNGQIDPVVRLWEVARGKEIGQLVGHQGIVQTLAFSPDGKTLASGSDDLTCLAWDVPSFVGRLKPAPAPPPAPQVLPKKRLEAAWADLARDPTQAYVAIWTLQAVPMQAIPLLRERVRTVAPVADPKQLNRWIIDLDDNSFTVRDKARREIEKLGEPAIPALQQALKGQPTLEARRQLQAVLAVLEPNAVGVSPWNLRELRAVQVLESIGTLEARQLLQTWAKGVSEASLTREAQAALTRLAKRLAVGP